MKRWFSIKRAALLLILALAAYLLGYFYIRATSVQTWEKDGRNYVIFPKEPLFIYYVYRPLSLVDGRVTGMGFHIGPHEN